MTDALFAIAAAVVWLLMHQSASFTLFPGWVSQEWQARRAQGAVALTTLQSLLGQLEPAAMLPGSAKFWQRITSQVQPSSTCE